MKKLNKGFTLIEVLIALFILAIISVIATAGLRSVINLQRGTRADLAQLQQLQIAMSLIERDLSQVIDRPITNSQGQIKPPIRGTSTQVSFTRAGFSNPNMVFKRSSLQRVRYYLAGDKLVRATWTHIDAAPKTRPDLKVLLTQVKQLTIGYIGPKGQSVKSWAMPSAQLASATMPKVVIPAAVIMHLNLGKQGGITRVFRIAGRGFQHEVN